MPEDAEVGQGESGFGPSVKPDDRRARAFAIAKAMDHMDMASALLEDAADLCDDPFERSTLRQSAQSALEWTRRLTDWLAIEDTEGGE